MSQTPFTERPLPREKDFNASLGLLLQRERKKLKLNLEQCGRRIGVTKSVYYTIETGRRAITFYELARLTILIPGLMSTCMMYVRELRDLR